MKILKFRELMKLLMMKIGMLIIMFLLRGNIKKLLIVIIFKYGQVMLGVKLKNLLDIQIEKDIFRVRTKHGVVDVTEDHNLINRKREMIKPCDFEIGEELLHNYMEFGESQITFDEIINKTNNIEPETLKEKEMFVKGFFLGDGSSGMYIYKIGKKYCWHLNNLDFNIIEKLQRFCKDIWEDVNFKIDDIRQNSNINGISSDKKKLAIGFDKVHTKDKEKRIACDIINGTIENKKWFLIGFYCADGNRKNKQKIISFCQKHKFTMSFLNYLCQPLGLKTCISMRDDIFNIFDKITVKNQND